MLFSIINTYIINLYVQEQKIPAYGIVHQLKLDHAPPWSTKLTQTRKATQVKPVQAMYTIVLLVVLQVALPIIKVGIVYVEIHISTHKVPAIFSVELILHFKIWHNYAILEFCDHIYFEGLDWESDSEHYPRYILYKSQCYLNSKVEKSVSRNSSDCIKLLCIKVEDFQPGVVNKKCL